MQRTTASAGISADQTIHSGVGHGADSPGTDTRKLEAPVTGIVQSLTADIWRSVLPAIVSPLPGLIATDVPSTRISIRPSMTTRICSVLKEWSGPCAPVIIDVRQTLVKMLPDKIGESSVFIVAFGVVVVLARPTEKNEVDMCTLPVESSITQIVK